MTEFKFTQTPPSLQLFWDCFMPLYLQWDIDTIMCDSVGYYFQGCDSQGLYF